MIRCVKGAGGDCQNRVYVVSNRGRPQLSNAFDGIKKNVPSQSYRILKSQKYIQLHCAWTSIAIPQKST